MGGEPPANPYPIDPEQELSFYVFFKGTRLAEHVDKVLADFIGCVIDKPSHCRREITVWRGEYDNAHGIAMWSIGLPKRLPQGLYTSLLKAARRTYDDYGSGPPSENGCKPYLLLAQGRVWQFDARRPPFPKAA